ncbi:MAG: PspC domain-containing protein [Sporichthyaceae bacterium]
MTESLQTPAGVPDTAAANAPGPRRIRRSVRDRMLAGVCGGVGEALGIDPVVIRVAVVVLTFFGGAGVVAYIAGWLLLPDAGGASPVRRALARRGGEAWTGIALIGLLTLTVVVTLDSLLSGWGPGHERGPFPVLVLVGLFAGGYLLLKRHDQMHPGAAPIAPVVLDTPVASSVPAAAEPPPATPEPRSSLLLATSSLVLIALGALAVAQTLGVDVPPVAYPAVVLAGTGIGLIVGAWWGRARSLIALGTVGLVALGPTSLATQFEGAWNSDGTPIRPTSALAPEYRYRTGQIVLDLTTLAPGEHATKVSLGAGEIRVIVPHTMDVRLDARLRLGELSLFGDTAEGFGNRRTVTDNGPDGPGGGSLALDVNQGVGHLEIVRDEPAPVPPAPAPVLPEASPAAEASPVPSSAPDPQPSIDPPAPATPTVPEATSAPA